MYRIAICDDEIIFANDLKKTTQEILTELSISYEITIYSNILDLVAVITNKPKEYHLLMLDILLGKTNGINAAKFLRKKGNDISIVFISSSKEFALDGYAVYPIHYLLKPVRKQQLYEVIQKEYNEKFLVQHILITQKGGNKAIELNSILYVEALNRKIYIHTTDNTYEVIGKLKEFIQSMPENLFVQCHKSYIISISKINKVSRSSFSLKNGMVIPIGRAYYENAMKKFISFIE